MKLVIQIPCLDEEVTLPATVADLPRSLPGVDTIELLVIDDGSSDRTSEIAHRLGAARVVRFPARRGLARGFEAGLREALRMGADIIVNTDADNQYYGGDIGRLIAPILERRADIVIGSRPINSIAHFSPMKKLLQKLGSAVVRALSQADVPDATSGFRAYSRDAALRMTIVTNFTYTVESIIQASHANLVITNVPVRTNAKTRESRLFRGLGSYVTRSLGTMLRVWVLYQPMRFYLTLSALSWLISLVLFGRFAWFYFTIPGQTGHIQSVMVAGVFAIIGTLFGSLAVLADLMAMNRRLLEELLVNSRAFRSDPSYRDLRRDEIPFPPAAAMPRSPRTREVRETARESRG